MRLQLALFLSLPALALARAAPWHTKRNTEQIYDGALVGGKTYDYVIAGGGLGGVVLAARLSEDSSKTVLVIEAGYSEEHNSVVTDASQYQAAFGTWLDWQYQTVPQTSANGQTQTVRAGRALGGSTAINGMAWSKPHSFQLDALETVGNAGVNWNSLQPYMQRAEGFHAPSASQLAAGLTYQGSCHGTGGPIAVIQDGTPNALERAVNTTAKNLGLPYPGDLSCGNPAGLSPISHNNYNNIRSDAYRGYLFGKDKPNLTIIAGSNVGRVLLSSDSTPRATGVEFRDQTGTQFTVNARREVLVALGSIKTPVILQQSGIGPQAVLQAAGVTQRVNLPIGQNLIDQVTTTTDFSFSAASGGGQGILFPRFSDVFTGSDATRAANLLNNNLESYVQDAINNGAATSANGLRTVLQLQRDWILNKGVGISENYDYSYGSTLGYDSWYLLPFGRGSVKITSNNPYSGSSFTIDPRFFANEFDSLASGATARFTRRLSTTAPLSSIVTGETRPGSGGVTDTLDGWTAWTKSNYRSNWHPIGTVSMMSRDLGGCVDSRHRVYGVNGLRVVDGSNLPFQVSSHLMSVLYGLAERASDLIKADNSGTTPTSSSSSSTPSPSASSSAGRVLHPNGDTSKCLEVVNGNFANGAAVAISDCTGSARQKWTFTNGNTAVQVAGQNFCLDATSASPGSGTKMKIWQCYSGLAAQSWNYASNVLKLQSANQCLDLTDGLKTNGNVVQVWQCYAGSANQQWTL